MHHLPPQAVLYRRLNNRYIYPNNRADLGRLPFTFWADICLDYTFRLGDRYRVSINLQINNVTSTSTIQSWITGVNLDGTYVDNAQILDGTLARDYSPGKTPVHRLLEFRSR